MDQKRELTANFTRARILEDKLKSIRTALTAHTDAHLTQNLEIDGSKFVNLEQSLEKAVRLYDQDKPLSQEEYARLSKEADEFSESISKNIDETFK